MVKNYYVQLLCLWLFLLYFHRVEVQEDVKTLNFLKNYWHINDSFWPGNADMCCNCTTCNWTGVACNYYERVAYLFVPIYSEEGNIPTQIDLLTDLIAFNLYTDTAQATMPSQMTFNLNFLVKRCNNETTFGNLTNQYCLSINQTGSTTSTTSTAHISTQIGNLIVLTSLDICTVSTTVPPNIETIFALSALKFNDAPSQIDNLVSLQNLKLSNNDLERSSSQLELLTNECFNAPIYSPDW